MGFGVWGLGPPWILGFLLVLGSGASGWYGIEGLGLLGQNAALATPIAAKDWRPLHLNV